MDADQEHLSPVRENVSQLIMQEESPQGKDRRMRIETFDTSFLVPPEADLIKINSTAGNVDANLPFARPNAGREIVFKCVGGQGMVRLVPAKKELIDDINDYVFDGLWDSIRVVSDGICWLIVV